MDKTFRKDHEPHPQTQTMTPKAKRSRPPWRGDLIAGVGCSLVALFLVLLIPKSTWPQGLLFAVAPLLIGAICLRSAARRYYGQFVEANAIAALRRKAPKEWQIEDRVPIGQGDLDLSVLTQNRLFAIEIKSQRRVTLNSPLLGREQILVSGRRFPQQDPLEQAKAVALRCKTTPELKATPVLWFPQADSAIIKRMRCGVLLVFGRPHLLIKALERR